jgi:hypothetical protein
MGPDLRPAKRESRSESPPGRVAPPRSESPSAHRRWHRAAASDSGSGCPVTADSRGQPEANLNPGGHGSPGDCQCDSLSLRRRDSESDCLSEPGGQRSRSRAGPRRRRAGKPHGMTNLLQRLANLNHGQGGALLSTVARHGGPGPAGPPAGRSAGPGGAAQQRPARGSTRGRAECSGDAAAGVARGPGASHVEVRRSPAAPAVPAQVARAGAAMPWLNTGYNKNEFPAPYHRTGHSPRYIPDGKKKNL